MRSNKSNSTKNQTAPAATQSRGDSVNQVTLIGRLVAAPELRETASGKHVTTVRVATDGKIHAEFHDVVLWGQLADFAASHLGKGRLVYIEGRLQSRQWQASDAALDARSRSSPIGSRRSPLRALRRLRRRDRRGSSPRGSHPRPSRGWQARSATYFSGSALEGRTEPHGVKALRAAASLRYSREDGVLLPLTPCFPFVSVRAHEPRRERSCSHGLHNYRSFRAGGVPPRRLRSG